MESEQEIQTLQKQITLYSVTHNGNSKYFNTRRRANEVVKILALFGIEDVEVAQEHKRVEINI